MLQLHDDLALHVDNIVVTGNKEPQLIIGWDVLSIGGNEHVSCTGMRAEQGGDAWV